MEDEAHANVGAGVGVPATDSIASNTVLCCARVGSAEKTGCASSKKRKGDVGGWLFIFAGASRTGGAGYRLGLPEDANIKRK